MRQCLFAVLLVGACKGADTPATPPPEPAPSHVPGSENYPPSVAWGLPPIKSGQPLAPVRFNVTIGPRNIQLDGVDIVPLPADMSHGVDGSYKRSGPKDLYLVPLGDAIDRARKGAPSNDDGARIEVSPEVSFRVFVEVAFTLGQNAVRAFHLVAPSTGGDVPKGKLAEIVSMPPRPGADARGLALTLILVPEGISIKARGGNVAPGCQGAGPGLAFTKDGSGYPFGALAACAGRLKGAAPEFAQESRVTVTANSNIEFREVMAAINAVRGEHRELFPDVTFGIAR